MNSTHFVLSGGDESTIRALVQRMMHGFNARNADEFYAPFTEDADCVIRNGQHLKGRSAIRQRHAEIFNSIYRDSQSESTIEQIRLLRSEYAQAAQDSAWLCTGLCAGAIGRTRGIQFRDYC